MKNRILLMAAPVLAVVMLAGCGQQSSENNTPATSNPAGGQQAPNAVDTNTPAATNSPGTNSPPATSP